MSGSRVDVDAPTSELKYSATDIQNTIAKHSSINLPLFKLLYYCDVYLMMVKHFLPSLDLKNSFVEFKRLSIFRH